MLLLDEEQEAFSEVLFRFTQGDFSAFLLRINGPRLKDFSAAGLPMPVIAVNFAEWLDVHPDKMPRVLKGLAEEIEQSPEAPILKAAAARLEAIGAKARAAGPATQAPLAAGVPIVDRAVLRVFLEDAIASAGNPMAAVKLVKVQGERGLGRSHSWHLIKYVADCGAARAIKIDLISATLKDQTLDVLFGQLTRLLNLNGAVKPSSDGATADTLAARYAEEIAGCLSTVAPQWPKPLWLAFDNLDRDIRPEIKRFVSLLASARLDGTFDKCVIFLLGPDALTEPDDPSRLARNEPLVTFNDSDVSEAAEKMNALGARALSITDLKARVDSMLALRSGLSSGEFCKQVATRLVDLRIEVGA
jgi:hypothetical protein